MKKIENLIKNKTSINTCKKFKFKSYINKTNFKKKKFFFLKFHKKTFNFFKNPIFRTLKLKQNNNTCFNLTKKVTNFKKIGIMLPVITLMFIF